MTLKYQLRLYARRAIPYPTLARSAPGYDVDSIRKPFKGNIRAAVYKSATTFYNGTIL